MRTLRMLFLSIGAVVAALAFASSASAQTTVEVDNEATDAHCPAVTLVAHVPGGGCAVTANTTANAVLHNHLVNPGTETPVSSCTNQFDARIGETGHGYIYNQVLGGDLCGLQPCAEESGARLPWEFQISEQTPSNAGTERLRVTFCVNNMDCLVDVNLQDAGDHEYVLSAFESPCINLGGAIELSGQWAVNGAIEVEHDNDV